MSTVDVSSVIQIDDFIYNVPSIKDSKKIYEINTIVS